jgi:histidyl-tRNA synthetase
VEVGYDDLTGIFGLKHEWCWNFFGLDRIYLVVEELNLFGNSHRIKSCLLITAIPKRFTYTGLKVTSAQIYKVNCIR